MKKIILISLWVISFLICCLPYLSQTIDSANRISASNPPSGSCAGAGIWNTNDATYTCINGSWITTALTATRNYLVCAKANGSTCVSTDSTNTWNGNVVAAPTIADTNDCVTVSTPCRSIDGVQAKFGNISLQSSITFYLADAADTGSDAYTTCGLKFSNLTTGSVGKTIFTAGFTGGDSYPQSVIYIHGNNTTPNNVPIDGATVVGGTTPGCTGSTAFYFLNTNARISGVNFRYYDTVSTPNAGDVDLGAYHCAGNSDCYLETSNITDAGNSTATMFLVQSGARAHFAGTINTTNARLLFVDTFAYGESRTPLGWPTVTTTINANIPAAFTSNLHSELVFFGPGTYTFTGTGTYTALKAIDNSEIQTINDPRVGTQSMTFNGANLTIFAAYSGAKILAGCGGSGNTCTFTSYKSHSTVTQNSFVVDNVSNQTTGDSATTGGCIIYVGKANCTLDGNQTINLVTSAAGTTLPGGIVGFTHAYAVVQPAATNATIGTTSLGAVDATFNDFTYSFSIFQTDVGGTCSTASTVAVNVIYTPPSSFYGGTVPVTVQVPIQLGNGTTAAVFSTSGSGSIGAVNIGSGFWKIRQLFNNQISFSTTYTNGTCVGAQPNIRLYTNLERQ